MIGSFLIYFGGGFAKGFITATAGGVPSTAAAKIKRNLEFCSI
jgi:hypothetical protein